MSWYTATGQTKLLHKEGSAHNGGMQASKGGTIPQALGLSRKHTVTPYSVRRRVSTPRRRVVGAA
jgi:hypothetical protein